MKVTILGASGETGQSIVNGLLESKGTFVSNPKHIPIPILMMIDRKSQP